MLDASGAVACHWHRWCCASSPSLSRHSTSPPPLTSCSTPSQPSRHSKSTPVHHQAHVIAAYPPPPPPTTTSTMLPPFKRLRSIPYPFLTPFRSAPRRRHVQTRSNIATPVTNTLCLTLSFKPDASNLGASLQIFIRCFTTLQTDSSSLQIAALQQWFEGLLTPHSVLPSDSKTGSIQTRASKAGTIFKSAFALDFETRLRYCDPFKYSGKDWMRIRDHGAYNQSRGSSLVYMFISTMVAVTMWSSRGLARDVVEIVAQNIWMPAESRCASSTQVQRCFVQLESILNKNSIKQMAVVSSPTQTFLQSSGATARHVAGSLSRNPGTAGLIFLKRRSGFKSKAKPDPAQIDGVTVRESASLRLARRVQSRVGVESTPSLRMARKKCTDVVPTFFGRSLGLWSGRNARHVRPSRMESSRTGHTLQGLGAEYAERQRDPNDRNRGGPWTRIHRRDIIRQIHARHASPTLGIRSRTDRLHVLIHPTRWSARRAAERLPCDELAGCGWTRRVAAADLARTTQPCLDATRLCTRLPRVVRGTPRISRGLVPWCRWMYTVAGEWVVGEEMRACEMWCGRTVGGVDGGRGRSTVGVEYSSSSATPHVSSPIPLRFCFCESVEPGTGARATGRGSAGGGNAGRRTGVRRPGPANGMDAVQERPCEEARAGIGCRVVSCVEGRGGKGDSWWLSRRRAQGGGVRAGRRNVGGVRRSRGPVSEGVEAAGRQRRGCIEHGKAQARLGFWGRLSVGHGGLWVFGAKGGDLEPEARGGKCFVPPRGARWLCVRGAG
ncbi:hypothetical protein C8R43DRAFT_1199957 [Mycena crocata]|nr:hypothetical protein C8R43DRAFT_1199957 [Mycena crocata]